MSIQPNDRFFGLHNYPTRTTGVTVPKPALTPITGAIVPYRRPNQPFDRHVTASLPLSTFLLIDMMIKLICLRAFIATAICYSELGKVKIMISYLDKENKPI